MVVNALSMALFVLSGFKRVKLVYRNFFGLYVFDNSVLNTTGHQHQIIPTWNVDLEVKHRVWHKFWYVGS
jgi:hypothetical protein